MENKIEIIPDAFKDSKQQLIEEMKSEMLCVWNERKQIILERVRELEGLRGQTLEIPISAYDGRIFSAVFNTETRIPISLNMVLVEYEWNNTKLYTTWNDLEKELIEIKL